MKPSDIAKIAEELDKRAHPYAIGDMQSIRKLRVITEADRSSTTVLTPGEY